MLASILKDLIRWLLQIGCNDTGGNANASMPPDWWNTISRISSIIRGSCIYPEQMHIRNTIESYNNDLVNFGDTIITCPHQH